MKLSVIVAAQDGGPSLRLALMSLAAQLPKVEAEVLVADGTRGAEVQGMAEEFPTFRFLRLTAPISVPRLWTEGILAAKGDIVALTIENCVPAPDWAARMLSAHATGKCSVVGGAIDVRPAGLVDWAVYFCRYSSYMPPFAPRYLDDVPGDNCSYKREALEPVMHLASDGFWETFIHHEMRRRGELLLSDPGPVMTYCGGLSAWRFIRRRYLHGRYFAARRSRDFTPGQRLVRAAGFAAVPLLLLRRIGGRVWKHRKHRAKFLAALPLIACFLGAWAAGEGVGYLQGSAASTPPGSD